MPLSPTPSSGASRSQFGPLASSSRHAQEPGFRCCSEPFDRVAVASQLPKYDDRIDAHRSASRNPTGQDNYGAD